MVSFFDHDTITLKCCGMEEKKVFDYTKAQWMTLIVCYCIYFVFGGIESSQGVYYSVMKKELAIPYNVQGFLVSMTSWSFILTSPIIGYGMSFTDVKPIVIAGFVSYLCAYSSLQGGGRKTDH